MSRNTNYALMDKCRVYQLTVGQLYMTYSTVFPDECDKWMSFAEEELLHAKWLSIIKKYVDDGIISLKITKISDQSVDRAISFIHKQIQLSRKGKVDLHAALVIALQIEDSIIQKSFFNMFNFSNKKAEDIRRYITKETIDHREKLLLWLNSVDAANVKAA